MSKPTATLDAPVLARLRSQAYACVTPGGFDYLSRAEELLQWFEDNRLPCPAAAAAGMAAAAGDVAVLQQAYGQDCTADNHQVMSLAAAGGHVHVLAWAAAVNMFGRPIPQRYSPLDNVMHVA
ncbi:hypothetical protein WJX74_003510 [Apatococcus lobatus]|uniref:Uncharacterized protein n=1 Tax=Apatococcus lobatus TaxID=904363 RepID=A0AAW1S2Q1_9CHLO